MHFLSVTSLTSFALMGLVLACGSGASGDGEEGGGAGVSSDTGGSLGSGGASSSGGSITSGGQQSSSGGKATTGGASSSGGKASSGGASSSGGTATAKGGSAAGGAAGQSSGGTAAAGKSSGGGAGKSTGGSAATGGKSGSGGAATAGATATGGSGSGSGGASSGCTATSTPKEGKYTIAVGAKTRSFFMIPATTKDPVPLVLSFHGYGGNGEADQWTFGLRDTSGGKAVLMFPDGLAQAFNGGGLGWDTRNNTNEDMVLVRALIERAKAEHCIDTTRIYAVGFSWGGWMATQVGCALGSEIRAVASTAGGGPVGTCNGAISAMITHGASDTAEPIVAGTRSRDAFLRLNGCGTGSQSASLSPCVALSGCSKPVWWCQHAGGHEVPTFMGQGMWSFLTGAP